MIHTGCGHCQSFAVQASRGVQPRVPSSWRTIHSRYAEQQTSLPEAQHEPYALKHRFSETRWLTWRLLFLHRPVEARGIFALLFNDFGDAFVVRDHTDEPLAGYMITAITRVRRWLATKPVRVSEWVRVSVLLTFLLVLSGRRRDPSDTDRRSTSQSRGWSIRGTLGDSRSDRAERPATAADQGSWALLVLGHEQCRILAVCEGRTRQGITTATFCIFCTWPLLSSLSRTHHKNEYSLIVILSMQLLISCSSPRSETARRGCWRASDWTVWLCQVRTSPANPFGVPSPPRVLGRASKATQRAQHGTLYLPCFNDCSLWYSRTMHWFGGGDGGGGIAVH